MFFISHSTVLERQPTKLNRRSKDAGTPEKSGSPISFPVPGSGVDSDSPVPLVTSSNDNDGVQSLLINVDDLKSVSPY